MKENTKVKKKVMIVDDDKEFLEEIKETVSLSGYEPVPVNDSYAAIQAAKKEKPDIILLDLKMDGMNGFQLAMLLKQNSVTSRIPIIIMTGHNVEEMRGWLKNSFGIDKFLLKPFNPLDLISRIEKSL